MTINSHSAAYQAALLRARQAAAIKARQAAAARARQAAAIKARQAAAARTRQAAILKSGAAAKKALLARMKSIISTAKANKIYLVSSSYSNLTQTLKWKYSSGKTFYMSMNDVSNRKWYIAPAVVAPPDPFYNINSGDDFRTKLAAFPAGSTITVGPGTFIIDPSDAGGGPLAHFRNITIIGVGPSTIIKVRDGCGDFFSVFGGLKTATHFPIDGLTLRNFTLDLNPTGYGGIPIVGTNGSLGATTNAGALVSYEGYNIILDGLNIIYGSIDCVMGAGITVSNCTFTYGKPPNAAMYDNSAIYLSGPNTAANNNTFYGGDIPTDFTKPYAVSAIELHGGASTASGNKIYNYTTGFNLVSTSYLGNSLDTTSPSGSMTVYDNIISGAIYGILLWSTSKSGAPNNILQNVTMTGNDISISKAWTNAPWVAGIACNWGENNQGTYKNILASNNTITFDAGDTRTGTASVWPYYSAAISYVGPANGYLGGTMINVIQTNNTVNNRPATIANNFLPLYNINEGEDFRSSLLKYPDGSTITVGPGTFIVDPSDEGGGTLLHAKNITIVGTGINTIIKVKDDCGDFFSVFGGNWTTDAYLTGLKLKDFTLDLNPLAYGGVPTQGDVFTSAAGLLAWKNENITVDGLNIIYGGGVGIVLNSIATESKNAVIKNCTLTRTANPPGSTSFDHTGINITGLNHTITDNIITNTAPIYFNDNGYGSGIETHNGGSTVSGNTITGMRFGINIVSASTNDPTSPSGSMTVTNNTINNCAGGVVMWSRPDSGKGSGYPLNGVTITNNYINPSKNWGVDTPGHYVDNDWSAGIAVNWGATGTIKNVSISGNTIEFDVDDTRINTYSWKWMSSAITLNSGADLMVPLVVGNNGAGVVGPVLINVKQSNNTVVNLPVNCRATYLPEASPIYYYSSNKKIRGMWAGENSQHPWSTYETGKINTIINKWDVSDSSSLSASEIAKYTPWMKQASDIGIPLVLCINVWAPAYNDTVNNYTARYTKYIDYLGQEWANKPCPTDASFWSDHIGAQVRNLATQTNASAIILDFEIYWAANTPGNGGNPATGSAGVGTWDDRNDYTSPCFCSSCLSSFSTHKGFDVGTRQNVIANYFSEYNLYQRGLIAGYTSLIRTATPSTVALGSLRLEGSQLMQAWHPDRVLAPGDTKSMGNIPLYDGMVVGLGTVSCPAISFSEGIYYGNAGALQTPGTGISSYISQAATQYTEYGANAISVHGVQFRAFGPNGLASYAKSIALLSQGYWLFAGYTFDSGTSSDNIPGWYGETSHYNGSEASGSSLATYMTALGSTYP